MRPQPWVSGYQPGHENVGVKAVIDLLSDWYDALEDGNVALRLPDPTYQRRAGKAPWTEEDLERLVTAIDAEYQTEVNNRTIFGFSDANPGFERLALPQRLALAQALETVIAQHADESLKDYRLEVTHAAYLSINGHYASIHRDNWAGDYLVKGSDFPQPLRAPTLDEARAMAEAALLALPPKETPAYGPRDDYD